MSVLYSLLIIVAHAVLAYTWSKQNRGRQNGHTLMADHPYTIMYYYMRVYALFFLLYTTYICFNAIFLLSLAHTPFPHLTSLTPHAKRSVILNNERQVCYTVHIYTWLWQIHDIKWLDLFHIAFTLPRHLPTASPFPLPYPYTTTICISYIPTICLEAICTHQSILIFNSRI